MREGGTISPRGARSATPVRPRRALGAVAAAFTLLAVAAGADYDSHPELRPERRCAGIPPGAAAPDDPGGVQSIACQRLLWDLAATTRLGAVAAAAPLPEKRVPRYPGGLTDRPPPLYVGADGEGYESPGRGRTPLCADPDQVPWWKPRLDASGKPRVGKDPRTGQTGPLFEVACRRGTRVRFGPWQAGRSTAITDDIAEGVLRFENSARLDRDAELRGLDEKRDGRREWVVAVEFYNHFAIHHSVCWVPENARCDNPDDPWTASDPAQCWKGYQEVADGPDDPHGKGGCYAGDQDTRCTRPAQSGETAWFLTTVPGRYAAAPPDGAAMIGLEDQLWRCVHHVMLQWPIDDSNRDQAFHEVGMEGYGLDRPVDYRLQTGGLVNVAPEPQHGAAPGEVIGGAVGEMIVQYFTEPFPSRTVKPLARSAPVRNGDLSDFVVRFRKTPTPAR